MLLQFSVADKHIEKLIEIAHLVKKRSQYLCRVHVCPLITSNHFRLLAVPYKVKL